MAEAGSIARAGTRLNVSQPAASRQILALEAELVCGSLIVLADDSA